MNEVSVTPLGTVSPYTKDDKNCPGFLVESNGYKVLLDCGEGVSRYLKFPEDLNNMIIIISHLHKDHYSGISSIAYASYVYSKLGYLKNKINVFIPGGDLPKVSETLYYEDWGRKEKFEKKLQDFEYLINYGDENFLKFNVYEELFCYNSIKIIEHGDMKITFSKNPHNLYTYSTKIKVGDISIVYSSDTGYQYNSLKNFAKNADLLICESTFLKGQEKREDYHLFAYEAGMIARGANVKKLLLTHFWPEIDKELYVNEAREYFLNTEAAVEGKKLVLRRM